MKTLNLKQDGQEIQDISYPVQPVHPVLWIIALLMLFMLSSCRLASSKLRIDVLYSPGCIHCTEVIRADIEPLRARYAERIDITMYDIGRGVGKRLYQQAVEHTGKPFEELGVPVVLIGDQTLYGDAIQDRLDGLVREMVGE